MGAFSFLKEIIGPVSEIVNKSVKDKDLAAKINAEIFNNIIGTEKSYMEQQASIIKAEAQGESWLQRSWRPLIMLFFATLIGLYWFGFAPEYLVNSPATVEDLFDLLKLGIGGYIAGRSVEKTAKTLASAGGVKKVLGN